MEISGKEGLPIVCGSFFDRESKIPSKCLALENAYKKVETLVI